MAGEQRKDDRVPVNLRVRLQFANLDAFIAGFARNLSRDGMFLEDVASRPAGTRLRFELLLSDGAAALRGEGRVIWSRDSGQGRGVAVRFTVLDARSKALLDSLSDRAQIRIGSIPPPLPPSSAPRPVRKIDLSGVLQDLDRLERETGAVVEPRAPSRRPVRDLETELEALIAERPDVGRPPVVASLTPPPLHLGRSEHLVSDSDLPPVLGLVQAGGDLRPVEVHAMAVSHPPPASSDATDRQSTVPPEAMREPAPELELLPEAFSEEPPADEFTPLPPIPHPPRMPRADGAPAWQDAAPLPDLDLGAMEEPEGTSGATAGDKTS